LSRPAQPIKARSPAVRLNRDDAPRC